MKELEMQEEKHDAKILPIKKYISWFCVLFFFKFSHTIQSVREK